MSRKDSKTGIEHETAREYLDRVIMTSPNFQARFLAAYAQDQYRRFMKSCRARKVATRRSIFDILSGTYTMTGYANDGMIAVRSGEDIFHFPIFAEICGYRGCVPPQGAVVTGIQVEAERKPQEGKWGNNILKT